MRLPPVLSVPNEMKPFPSPPKCSGISRFHNDRHRHVWCLGFSRGGRTAKLLSRHAVGGRYGNGILHCILSQSSHLLTFVPYERKGYRCGGKRCEFVQGMINHRKRDPSYYQHHTSHYL
ncbi:hypothetical protein AVEN_26344-1 [Araneus ventricosus]|uniref:Uncharacterized protein n=1 Tax=Araneus ventricosus TaxID=182803 RepID=A0A4Y2AMH7_ARAVE|nr:hypothetical protein AVEN_26344-1 [Araneus ventricosus]